MRKPYTWVTPTAEREDARVRLGVFKARGDYQSEVGWPAYARLVQRHAAGAEVIVADNYGEAGALKLSGRGFPPIASAEVTMRDPVGLACRDGLLVATSNDAVRLHASRRTSLPFDYVARSGC